MVGLSAEFIAAADLLRPECEETSRPVLFLYCHGLELLLKAVIVSAGIDEDSLRRLGHELTRVSRVARRLTKMLPPLLKPEDYALIGLADIYYATKDFEYQKTGAKSYPSTAALKELSGRLLRPLRAHIDSSVRQTLRRGAAKSRPVSE